MRDFFTTHHRNPNFVGREAPLEDLRTALVSGRPVVLVGPEGIGKSQIADEYARLRVEDYDYRFWVRADDPTNLIIDYADLAGPLGLPYHEESDLNEAVDSVRNWLEQNRRWLLIFDDAPSATILESYLPQGETGQVIVTSSNSNWEDFLTIEVGTLNRSEAAFLLRKITGQEDVAALEALAEALGDLPLALELAGDYIRWTGISLSRYLYNYTERIPLSSERNAPEIPSSVATVWDISFEQVQAISQEGVDLLDFLAFLASEDLPLDLLMVSSDLDPEALDRGFKVLSQRGLVEIYQNTYSVHPQVQALALYRLDEASQRNWAQSTLQTLGGAFSSYVENLDTWPECSRLLPHALKSSEHAQKLKSGAEAASNLLNQVALYLHRRGYFVGARKVLERLLAMDEMIHGPDHPEVATDLNNLGSVLRLLGDLEGSKECFQRSLVIEERTSEYDPLKIAVRANNLGTVLRALGDLEGAKENFERALAIDEKAYGPNHFKTAIRLNNLGEVFQEMGQFEEARKNYQRALMIFQQFLGPGHHYTRRARENLNSLSED